MCAQMGGRRDKPINHAATLWMDFRTSNYPYMVACLSISEITASRTSQSTETLPVGPGSASRYVILWPIVSHMLKCHKFILSGTDSTSKIVPGAENIMLCKALPSSPITILASVEVVSGRQISARGGLERECL